MNWSICFSAGHCALGGEISVYIESEPTSSGAIRCIGPFVDQSISPEFLHREMAKLMVTLEKEFLNSDQYVVWCGYQESACCALHATSIMGSRCGYLPMLSLGTWLRMSFAKETLSREWKTVDSQPVHRAGLLFSPLRPIDQDLSVLHPTNCKVVLREMAQHANQILGSIERNKCVVVLQNEPNIDPSAEGCWRTFDKVNNDYSDLQIALSQ